MKWSIEQNEKLDRYQIYVNSAEVKALFTAFNAYDLHNKLVLNLFFEEKDRLYVILFAELDFKEKKLKVPSCSPVVVSHDDLEIIVNMLRKSNVRLGLHRSLFIVKESSFIAEFVDRLKNVNPDRTPYLGLSDMFTQMKSYFYYSYIGNYLLNKKVKTVLDIGCGSGYGSCLLAKDGLDVTAVDTDELPIVFAKRLFVDRLVSFSRQSIDTIIENGVRFDSAVACEVLEHVDNPEEFLKKILSTLKSEGYIALSLPSWKYHGIHLNSDHKTNWTFSKVKTFCRRFFKIEEICSINYSSDPEQYSVKSIVEDEQNSEHFIVLGRNVEPERLCVNPSSVLLVCHNIPPYEFSGTPIITWKYALNLKRLGYRVGILIPKLGKNNFELEERDGICIYSIQLDPYPNAFLNATFEANSIKWEDIEKVFIQFRPHIVHIIDYVNLPPQVLQMASDFGCVVIRQVWNTEEICFRMSPIISNQRRVCKGPKDLLSCCKCIFFSGIDKNDLFYIRETAHLLGMMYGWSEYIRLLYDRLFDVIFFSNSKFRDYFLKHVSCDKEKIFVIPHGFLPRVALSIDNFSSRGRMVFGYIGGIQFEKGIDTIIKVFKNLLYDQVELRVYGRIYDQELFKELCDVPNIKYMGEYTPEDLPDILKDIDIGIVPSYFDTYSLVLHEFLLHGVPVIATKFFGSYIVEDGKNGFLVDIGDVTGIKKKIEMILEDRNLLYRLREGARSTYIPTLWGEIDNIHNVYQRAYINKHAPIDIPSRKPIYNKTVASIVIPFFSDWYNLHRCLTSIEACGYNGWVEVIVVCNFIDNNTSLELKKKFPWAKVIVNRNIVNFAAACNIGAAEAKGSYIVFLGSSIVVTRGWLESLISTCRKEENKSIVGSKILSPDGSIQYAGIVIEYGCSLPINCSIMGSHQQGSEYSQKKYVDALANLSMLVPSDLFCELKGFEEVYQEGYEDIDICLKAKELGCKIIYEPNSKAICFKDNIKKYSNVTDINVFHRRWLPYVIKNYRKQPVSVESSSSIRPPVSIVIVTYNSLSTIAACLESVLSTVSPSDEIIVIDNASIDETAYYVNCLREALNSNCIKLHVNERNLDYARAADFGARVAQYDYIIFLNPDMIVYHGWLEGLLQPLLTEEEVAASGPLSNYVAGIQNVSFYLSRETIIENSPSELMKILQENYKGKIVPTDLLIGFCLAVKRSAYDKLGGFDEELFLRNYDLDFCWRLVRAGYKQVVVPSVFVFHKGQESFETEPTVKTKYLVQQSTNQLYEKLYDAYQGSPPNGKDLWKIEWFQPQQELLSVIIPIFRRDSLNEEILKALVRYTNRPYELIVVGSGNIEKPFHRVKSILGNKSKIIHCEEKLNYPLAYNLGLSGANGNYIVLMHEDTIVTPYWASKLLASFSVDNLICMVGPKTNSCYGPQQVDRCKYDISSLDKWARKWYLNCAGSLQTTDFLSEFLLMIKKELIEKIGGFDPLFNCRHFATKDYCLRARLVGYNLVVAEDVFVHHYNTESSRKSYLYERLFKTNELLFIGKWDLEFRNELTSSLDMSSVVITPTKDELYVPLDFASIFSPRVEPINPTIKNKPLQLLCIPDPSDENHHWLEVTKQFLKLCPSEKVGLILWIEPPIKSWLVDILSKLHNAARQIGISVDDARARITIESRRFPSSYRGKIYRLATHFVALPGMRCEDTIREARACGLKIISLKQALLQLKELKEYH